MKTEEALQLAKELISGPRAKTYGDKIQNHCNIAKLWTAYLDKEITAHDAAVMMALLKVARTKFGQPTSDTYVDDKIWSTNIRHVCRCSCLHGNSRRM